MTSLDKQGQRRILILLAPGFEEGPIVYCLDRMREAGLPVSLVGPSPRWIRGIHGISVRTDYSLEQLEPQIPHQLIVVSGGRQHIASLLADPRVRDLFQSVQESKGHVAATLSAESPLVQAGIHTLSHDSLFVQHGKMSVDEFANRLIEMVSE